MNIDIRIKSISDRSSVINNTTLTSKRNEKKEHCELRLSKIDGGMEMKNSNKQDHILGASSRVIIRSRLKDQEQHDDIKRLKLPIEI